MNSEILSFLACPTCLNADLRLLDDKIVHHGNRIHQGQLQCTHCEKVYPIQNGIPRFIDTQHLGSTQEAIAENFGEAWQIYAQEKQNPYTEEQFLEWIQPLKPADFQGRIVLDLGSGLGGFTAYAAGYGAQQIIGLEISHAIDASAHWMQQFPNLTLVQGDILQPPFKTNTFDLLYSIGVLHHLEHPKAGFQSAASLLKKEGRFMAWVYGRENNNFVIYCVEPLRKVASRLPVRFVRTILALPLSLILYPLLHTVYHPKLSKLFCKLPYHTYFQWLRKYGFNYVVGMVTDQLIPPKTHYLRRDELIEWYASQKLEIESLTHRNNMSWRILGKRP